MNNVKHKDPTTKNIPATNASYRTFDLYLGAYLKSNGIILQGIEKEAGKVTFIFQDEGDIQDLINKYFNDSNVKVLSFKAALRDLRSIIFNYQNSLPVKEK